MAATKDPFYVAGYFYATGSALRGAFLSAFLSLTLRHLLCADLQDSTAMLKINPTLAEMR
jgi:hypothetical protein